MLELIRKKLALNIKALRSTINAKEFGKRIKHRHRTFWSAPDAEVVRNTPMNAYDPLEKWQDVAHWQRKLSNKYNAREFASKHGCRVPDLYWRGRTVNTIDFDQLPPQFVIRPTIGHSSQRVFLMDRSVNLMDNRSYTPDELKKKLSEAVAENPYLEFLLEEFVKDENGVHRIPDDYKISVFNGEIAFIDVINRTSPKTGFSSCYTQHWERIENVAAFYEPAPLQNPPRCLDEMFESARQLSKAYKIFVRVDFYATDKGAVFGEFTPTPSLGDGFTAKADKLLTSYWDTYCNGMI